MNQEKPEVVDPEYSKYMDEKAANERTIASMKGTKKFLSKSTGVISAAVGMFCAIIGVKMGIGAGDIGFMASGTIGFFTGAVGSIVCISSIIKGLQKDIDKGETGAPDALPKFGVDLTALCENPNGPVNRFLRSKDPSQDKMTWADRKIMETYAVESLYVLNAACNGQPDLFSSPTRKFLDSLASKPTSSITRGEFRQLCSVMQQVDVPLRKKNFLPVEEVVLKDFNTMGEIDWDETIKLVSNPVKYRFGQLPDGKPGQVATNTVQTPDTKLQEVADRAVAAPIQTRPVQSSPVTPLDTALAQNAKQAVERDSTHAEEETDLADRCLR